MAYQNITSLEGCYGRQNFGAEREGIFGKSNEVFEFRIMVMWLALCDGWVADWADDSQEKWWPVFIWSVDLNRYVYTDLDCGTYDLSKCYCSDYVFPLPEIADHAGIQFESIYNDYFLTQNISNGLQ
jgi:hypothetical protein